MKKLFTLFALATLLFATSACTEEESKDYTTYEVSVRLIAPAEITDTPFEGVEIQAQGNTGLTLKAKTNASGIASFSMPEDIYNFSASHKFTEDGTVYQVNYQQQRAITKQDFANTTSLALEMTPVISQGGKQVILKELYVGGCAKDDGSGNYQYDKYVVIYNNSDKVAEVPNFCISNAGPYNAHGNNANYVDGKLVYAEEDYTPAYAYVFYLPRTLVMQPYTSATIALSGAIDHTTTYSNSVDLSEADFVCYDAEDFWSTSYHPVPSEKIPSENYMLASKFCAAGQNAASWSMIAPGIFIFSTGDNDPLAFTQSMDNRYYMPGKQDNPVYACAKIPNEWIFDAVDIWGADYVGESMPRFSPVLESGYIYMINKQGYSIYRNVDREATEALPENEGKLVYNYNLGTTDNQGALSTDLSGIDAEASIANGAHIVYMDTNNSQNDFHQRSVASLKQ